MLEHVKWSYEYDSTRPYYYIFGDTTEGRTLLNHTIQLSIPENITNNVAISIIAASINAMIDEGIP